MKKLEVLLKEELDKRPAGIDRWDRLWDAAVLLPIVYENDTPCILFEVRAKTLRRQPGEICFPGGRYECKDKLFVTTAIRETCEELGLVKEDIEIIGALDALVTHSGPIIHPFLGKLKNHRKISFSSAEVNSVFAVPVKFLLECNPRIGYVQLADKPREDFPFDLVPSRQRNWRYHKEYEVYFYEYEEKVIWGLTARILHAFLENYRDVMQKIVR